MSLREILAKMKLVELDRPAPAAAPPRAARPAPPPAAPAPRGLDLQEILGSLPPLPAIDERALPAAAGGEAALLEIPDLAGIYRAAGVVDPPHGFSAAKVHEILSAPEFAALDGPARAAALAGFLKRVPGGPVPIADIVQDAVRRDQALDRFEAFLRQKLAGRRDALESENAALQRELDELVRRHRERLDANRARLAEAEQQLADWLARKAMEERRLAESVAPFVEANPVSVAGGPEPSAS